MTHQHHSVSRICSALIIDDEPDARGVLRRMLELFYPKITKIEEAEDSLQAIKLAQKHQFDLAFIDIELRKDSGLELAQKLIKYCRNLIFVTAYDSYAVEAYRTEAIHYLLKPVDPDHLQEAIDRAELTNTGWASPNRLLLPTRNGVIILKYEDIIRIQGDGNYCKVICQDQKQYFVSRHLAYYEKLLNGLPFYRIHQSHLVNIDYVHQLLIEEGYLIELTNGERLPLARRRKDAFLERLQ